MAKVYDTATDLITFARGSSATYTGSDGTQQTAASDEPRIEYAADGTLKGLLIEEQRTNLLLNSDNPDTQVASLAAGSHTLSFVGGPSVTGISDSITANAVDVFVYDTSKDSDGGAWRTGSLAQASSWYAEASSPTRDPNTRSTRAEFPAVAVIVAEDHTITIYDGDDPSLPMWMVFPQNTGALGGVISADKDLTSVAMLNGVLVGGYGNGLSYVNFLSEVLERGFNGNTSNVGVLPFNVSERDQQPAGLGGTLNLEIVNATVNDVAMTVLPDAPTDPATGLPVPTIAVATDGGVSVIKDDGTVVDSSATFGAARVSFDDDGGVWWCRNTSLFFWFYSSVADYSAGDGFGDLVADSSVSTGPLTSGLSGLIAVGSNVYASGASESGTARQGLYATAVDYSALPSPSAKSLNALTTSDYATGWMPGDIKLAALADTTAETLSGTPLLDDDFAAGTTGWTFEGTATDTSTAGFLSGTAGSTTNLVAYQVIPTVAGQTYVLEVTTGPAQTGIYVSSFAPGYSNLGNSGFGTNATLSVTFVALGTTTYIAAMSGSGLLDAYIDNISVRLADPDRSVNGKGLAVHGSITKAAVATGADVVAYSGFSSSNYLEQPYNPDLDFGAYNPEVEGSGDFCVMAWVTFKSGSLNFIIDRCDSLSSTTDRWNFGLAASELFQRCDSTRIGIPHTFSDGVRYFICGVRTGGVFYAYVDGVLVGSATQEGDQTDASQSYPLTVASFGGSAKGQAPTDIALIRISATAPTADQIRKIYEDERPLFQPNAKATLTGSSDAVTALAHDPDTDLLHVGTSGGRSVFYGLRRINETATAVTTAISAVDGLIVEQ
jgi:hypothetical protein